MTILSNVDECLNIVIHSCKKRSHSAPISQMLMIRYFIQNGCVGFPLVLWNKNQMLYTFFVRNNDDDENKKKIEKNEKSFELKC